MTDITVLRGGTLKAGDTEPALRLKCVEDEDAFNLTGYDVQLLLKRSNADSLTVDATATINSETRGIVSYNWSNGETDTPGTYELEIVANDGTKEITFPNRGTQAIRIEDRLK